MILVISDEKKHVLETVLNHIDKVTVSKTYEPCSMCFVSKSPNTNITAPTYLYIETDPAASDMDALLYNPLTVFTNYKHILLPDCFKASKSYLETRYPNVPITVIQPVFTPFPNKVFEGVRPKTEKVNIVIRAKNDTFFNNSWRQLCIAEHAFHSNPELINDVYLFNAPKNKCAIEMYENLEIFKQKKLRTFIDFEPAQIVQHFNLQEHRTVYLMNSVAETFDPLALYCLQNQIGVVHTSPYLRSYNLGVYYESYDLDKAISAIKAFSTSDISCKEINNLLHKLKDTTEISNLVKSFTTQIKALYSTIFHPEDISIPLVIGYDNTLDQDENTKFFIETMKTNDWEYALLSVSAKWNGFEDKLLAVKRFLDTLPTDKVVVISDTRDVVCCRTSKHFLQAFSSKKKDISVSMELFCFNEFDADAERGNCVPLTKYWLETKPSVKPLRKFVNAGLICGRAGALRKFYTYAVNKGYLDDQIVLGRYINEYPTEIFADTEAELLHTTIFGLNAGLRSLEHQRQDSPTFAELFGRSAFFLHMPGLANEGSKTVYKFVKSMLLLGASDKTIHYKNYPDCDYYGRFVNGQRLEEN